MKSKRYDIHRPSAVRPEEYDFVGIEYMRTDSIEDCYMLATYRAQIAAHKKMTGADYSHHRHGGNCHVCGAHCIYTVLFYHARSNAYIRTGFECADKMIQGDAINFRAIRAHVDREVKTAREAKAGRQKAELILTEAGLARAWQLFQLYQAHNLPALAELGATFETKTDSGTRVVIWEEVRKISELIDGIVRWGTMTEGREKFIRSLLDRILRRKEIEAERVAERQAAKPAPTGRQTVELEILKTEYREGGYGTSLKMVGKHTDGWCCWGTVPTALEYFTDEQGQQRGLRHGDRVRITATFEPSAKDPKFGFFKRPTKAERIAIEAAPEASSSAALEPEAAEANFVRESGLLF